MGLLGALKRFPEIIRKRRVEKRASVIFDKELMKMFDEYYFLGRTDIN